MSNNTCKGNYPAGIRVGGSTSAWVSAGKQRRLQRMEAAQIAVDGSRPLRSDVSWTRFPLDSLTTSQK
jgi:hypothetical protein